MPDITISENNKSFDIKIRSEEINKIQADSLYVLFNILNQNKVLTSLTKKLITGFLGFLDYKKNLLLKTTFWVETWGLLM